MKHETMQAEAVDETVFLTEMRDVRDRLDRLVQAAAAAEASIPSADTPHGTECQLRRFQRLITKRNQLFGTKLFSDPGWEMLLEMYIMELSGKRDYVSSICIASGGPPTTALRYISALEHEELIFRVPDLVDGRRCYLHLTPRALIAMETFFRELFAVIES